MNERIQALAKQADQYAVALNPEQDSYGRSANPSKFAQDRDSKFAELIVQDCIALFNYDPTGAVSSMHEWLANNRSITVIKEHFGVE